MRPGHKSSGGLEKGFEADIEVEAMLVPVEQRHLIDEDSAQGKALSVAEPFGGNRAVDSEDAFEMLVEVLHGQGPQLVEDPANLDPAVCVGISPASGGHQDLV